MAVSTARAVDASLACPCCGAAVDKKMSLVGRRAPRRFEDCERVCTACGRGAFSNGKQKPTWIFRDCLENVPANVRDEALGALRGALNERARRVKEFRFGFESSEDAVTWTVMRYLQTTRNLAARVSAVTGRKFEPEPSVLMWGSPIPSSSLEGTELRAGLVRILRALGENPTSFSEPDVVLDFGSEGLVVVEAKFRSGNDWKPADYAGWTRGYLKAPAFRDAEAALQIGRYELARNWRIAWELGGGGRPVCLLNLGRRELFEREDVGPFRACLSTSAQATFLQATWDELLGDERAFPDWFLSWRRSRGV